MNWDGVFAILVYTALVILAAMGFYDKHYIEGCRIKYDVHSCVIVALPKPMREGEQFCTNSTEKK